MRSSVFQFLGLALVAALVGCADSELRGSVEPSKDGKTYLIIAEDNGGGCAPILLNGKPWPHAIGVPGEISPGTQTIQCGSSLEFNVQDGVVFTFDYWGP